MPSGSAYQGPPEALELYRAAVEASGADTVVKGAKNPYTSLNGHMFSFLDGEGSVALRLSDESAARFRAVYESGPVEAYGSIMRGYSSVPSDLLRDTDQMAEWITESRRWIGTLEPKPSKKS